MLGTRSARDWCFVPGPLETGAAPRAVKHWGFSPRGPSRIPLGVETAPPRKDGRMVIAPIWKVGSLWDCWFDSYSFRYFLY